MKFSVETVPELSSSPPQSKTGYYIKLKGGSNFSLGYCFEIIHNITNIEFLSSSNSKNYLLNPVNHYPLTCENFIVYSITNKFYSILNTDMDSDCYLRKNCRVIVEDKQGNYLRKFVIYRKKRGK